MAQLRYFSGFQPLPLGSDGLLMKDAHPLYRRSNESADAVVICLHGFTGTPYEVAPAVNAIAHHGVEAVAPLLPGHGYRERDDQERAFAAITPTGMLDAARAEIAQARQRYAKVGMFGFSMGGSIALTMAAEGLLDACAVAAPALRLPRQAEILIPLLGWASFTLAAPSQEPFYLPTYEFYHSQALRTLWQLGRDARQQLGKIRCPILGVHSHQDSTVPPVVLDLMQQRLPGAIATAWFDQSGHSMLLDVEGPAVAIKIADFFRYQLLK
ncbi:MAG: alpha/beta fold hydrolase [Leptolyngbya sp. SIOISBB]|nr:alpha/beta fold hydrolase [Leptolyngbya sp. SIOISBB]